MKKAIVLSVSMGVLGFSAPLVSEQVARAEVVAISNTNIQEVKIVPKLRVKDVRGSETILKANQTFIVPVDLSQTRRVAVPAIEHYMPKDKELVVTPLAVNGLFANYVADKAVVTVHYQDEQGKQIQKDIAFDNGTIFGNYKLKSKEYKIPGYELINTEAINGEIKSTDWDVNLIYRNLNPILQPENPVNPVQLIIPDVKQSEKATVEPALPAPEVKSIPEVPAAERQSAKKTTLTTKAQPVAVSPAPATPKLIEPEKSIVPEVSVTPQMPVAPKLETKEQVTIPDKPTVIDPKAEATAPTTLKEKST
ncbi:MAG: MucBP domain-containing protein, partial [Lactiplantibacillus plantarum]